jgi:hypothetical protein
LTDPAILPQPEDWRDVEIEFKDSKLIDNGKWLMLNQRLKA